MIIKKYLAATEREAIELARNELGSNAVVMNIKKVHPQGIFKLFVKTKVEVTAALDDSVLQKENEEGEVPFQKAMDIKETTHLDLKVEPYAPDLSVEEEKKDVVALEERLNSLQKILEKQMTSKETSNAEESQKKEKTIDGKKAEGDVREESDKENKVQAYKKLIYKQLIDSEVDDKIATELIHQVESSLPEDATVDNILASIYQKIILTIGRPYTIEPDGKHTKFVFFLGSTGVGKTTTIAKIASHLKLEHKYNTALVTADTYRIAAVEQIKTYASILDVYLKVVYSPSELASCLPELREYDVCLIDTAGRSHRNQNQIDDIKELIEQVPITERDVYLVLNAGTKYSDLKEIAKVYSDITDYSIVFTKLDETTNHGALMNMKVLTKCPLSYITWGQNVPDDIGEIDAQKVAKELLGGKS